VGRDGIEPPTPGFQSAIALDPKRRRSTITEHSGSATATAYRRAGWRELQQSIRHARFASSSLSSASAEVRLGRGDLGQRQVTNLYYLLPFPGDLVEPPLDLIFRQPAATYHDPGLPVHVANILERIPLQQD
jgi:hypothetical protein